MSEVNFESIEHIYGLKYYNLVVKTKLYYYNRHIKKLSGNSGSFEMEEFVAYSANGRLYFYGGFIYQKEQRRNNTVYYKCRRKKCSGRGIVSCNSFQQSAEHNHENDIEYYKLCIYRETLRQRASTENISLRKIFREEAERQKQTGKFKQVNHLLQRSRKRKDYVLPRKLDPNTVLPTSEFQVFLANEMETKKRPFHGGMLHVDGFYHSYHISPAIRDCVTRMQKAHELVNMHIDTFKKNGDGNIDQLFIINVLINRKIFPLIYTILSRRTKADYLEVLTLVAKEIWGKVPPNSIICDGDDELRNACRQVFPESFIKSCDYNYSRAISINDPLSADVRDTLTGFNPLQFHTYCIQF